MVLPACVAAVGETEEPLEKNLVWDPKRISDEALDRYLDWVRDNYPKDRKYNEEIALRFLHMMRYRVRKVVRKEVLKEFETFVEYN